MAEVVAGSGAAVEAEGAAAAAADEADNPSNNAKRRWLSGGKVMSPIVCQSKG